LPTGIREQQQRKAPQNKKALKRESVAHITPKQPLSPRKKETYHEDTITPNHPATSTLRAPTLLLLAAHTEQALAQKSRPTNRQAAAVSPEIPLDHRLSAFKPEHDGRNFRTVMKNTTNPALKLNGRLTWP
jgi:hypothetical protein